MKMTADTNIAAVISPPKSGAGGGGVVNANQRKYAIKPEDKKRVAAQARTSPSDESRK